jgi:hypothetical protein
MVTLTLCINVSWRCGEPVSRVFGHLAMSLLLYCPKPTASRFPLLAGRAPRLPRWLPFFQDPHTHPSQRPSQLHWKLSRRYPTPDIGHFSPTSETILCTKAGLILGLSELPNTRGIQYEKVSIHIHVRLHGHRHKRRHTQSYVHGHGHGHWAQSSEYVLVKTILQIWGYQWKHNPMSDIMSDFSLFNPILKVPASGTVRYLGSHRYWTTVFL